MRRLGLPIGKVLSSAYCRTLETARLAFGRATVHAALLNTIAAEHDARWRQQIRSARRLLGTALSAQGRFAEAVETWDLWSRLDSRSAEEDALGGWVSRMRSAAELLGRATRAVHD